MSTDVLRKHNDIPGAKKVFFVPICTGQLDLYNAFIANSFELHSLNFDPSQKKYIKENKSTIGNVFLEACKKIKPDWVYFMLDAETLPLNVIKLAKEALPNTIFTNWTGDVREKPKQFVAELGKVVDITLIVSTGQLDMYRNNGLKRVEFLQAGIDTEKFFRMSENDRKNIYDQLGHDIVFCANNSSHFPGALLRGEVASRLSKLYSKRFGLYGGGWEHRNSTRGSITYFVQNRVYNGSKIVISINNFNDVEMYFSARQLAAMGSGTLTISAYVPGLERYFDNNHDLVWFKSADECMDLVQYYLKHEDEARQIGINGAKKIQEFHSRVEFIKRLATRLGFLEGDSYEF